MKAVICRCMYGDRTPIVYGPYDTEQEAREDLDLFGDWADKDHEIVESYPPVNGTQ